jgi:glycerophosphoryl diester phosphodiesterase
MLQLLAHRGLWNDPSERNTRAAFRRAFEHNYGVEVDVRDHNGRLVVSHDPPTGEPFSFDEFLELRHRTGNNGTIAVNIKSDGLQPLLSSSLSTYAVENYFTFDMSFPDLLGYRKARLRYFSRQSDMEPLPQGTDGAAGTWLDGFEKDWNNFEIVTQQLSQGKGAAIVSPELHGRPPLPYWLMVRDWFDRLDPGMHDRIWICTDHPIECEAYFNGND